MREVVVAARMTVVTLILTGIAYPLATTGLARSLFPHQAGGSLIRAHGKIVGSELIGQRFRNPAIFRDDPPPGPGLRCRRLLGVEPGRLGATRSRHQGHGPPEGGRSLSREDIPVELRRPGRIAIPEAAL
jgi:hypothetical protein